MAIEYRSERQAIRQAMLKAQAEWLGDAEMSGATMTEKTVARVIADAFGTEANKYKDEVMKEMNGDVPSGFFDDDDPSPSGALPELG